MRALLSVTCQYIGHTRLDIMQRIGLTAGLSGSIVCSVWPICRSSAMALGCECIDMVAQDDIFQSTQQGAVIGAGDKADRGGAQLEAFSGSYPWYPPCPPTTPIHTWYIRLPLVARPLAPEHHTACAYLRPVERGPSCTVPPLETPVPRGS